MILPELSRDRLKELCRAFDLDDGGREKGALIDRLAGGKAERSPRTGETSSTTFSATRRCTTCTGGLHILRHTFCSHLAMKGAPALSIQKLAGHEDLQTTLGYVYLAVGETDRAIRLLEMPHSHAHTALTSEVPKAT